MDDASQQQQLPERQTTETAAPSPSVGLYVRIPLRHCDYDVPIVARVKPFFRDSKHDTLAESLAAAIVLRIRAWREFQHWPISEVDGVTGHVAPEYAYAEMRWELRAYGYAEADIEACDLADVERLLDHGAMRRHIDEHLRDPEGWMRRAKGEKFKVDLGDWKKGTFRARLRRLLAGDRRYGERFMAHEVTGLRRALREKALVLEKAHYERVADSIERLEKDRYRTRIPREELELVDPEAA